MVQKKAGRPRSFDRETALEAALNVFWAKGYDGASMADLTGAMGINKPSLYAAFGDKDALFAETIARYAERYFGGALQAFLSESSPEKAVHAALLAALEGATRADTEAVGCLLAVGAAPTAVSRPWIGEQVKHLLAGAVEAMTERFERDKAAGALSNGFPSRRRAWLLLELIEGQAFRARFGESRDDIACSIQERVNAVLG